MLTPTTTIVDGGSFTEGGITLHNAGRRLLRRAPAPAGAPGLLRRLLLQRGRRSLLPRERRPAEVGIRPRDRPPHRDRPSRGGRRAAADAASGATSSTRRANTDRPWSEGDNVNLAVGQGDLQTNPLQMAVAYAAIANGGDVVRPHVGMEVEDSSGRAVQEIDPAPQRHLDIAPQYRQAILEGIHMAAQSPGGTSYPVFGNFPIPMAGKTGTAQRPGQADQSWYVALAPYPEPADRRRGDDRAGRVRSRLRGAGGAADPRRLLQRPQAGGQGGRRQGPRAGPAPGRDRARAASAGNPY